MERRDGRLRRSWPALEWIAAHRERYGIRVVNLSYGTDSSQKYLEDPLNHAVERLWRAGVLVVVGAGNRGDGGSKIDKPGDDPYVLTVGAADTRNTARRPTTRWRRSRAADRPATASPSRTSSRPA